VAVTKLQEAKQTPDPDLLPILQLMQYGLTSGEVEMPDRIKGELADSVERLVGLDDAVAMRLIVEDDEMRYLDEAELARMTPEEVAADLIQVLYLRLASRSHAQDE